MLNLGKTFSKVLAGLSYLINVDSRQNSIVDLPALRDKCVNYEYMCVIKISIHTNVNFQEFRTVNSAFAPGLMTPLREIFIKVKVSEPSKTIISPYSKSAT